MEYLAMIVLILVFATAYIISVKNNRPVSAKNQAVILIK